MTGHSLAGRVTIVAEGPIHVAGNKSTGDITIYTWSTQGQLLEVARPGGSASTYRYEPFGRRIEVNDNVRITRYAWDDANIVGEYDGGNQLTAAFVTTPQPGQLLGVTRPDGQQYDAATGLYSMRSRYHDPTLGRFISADPVAASNQYWYAEADPVDMVDVFGETSSVECSSVSSLNRGVALAVRNQGGSYRCLTSKDIDVPLLCLSQ